MYRIFNVAGNSQTRLQRRVTPGRASRTRVFRFLGRRIVPSRSILVVDEVVEAHRVALEKAQKTGLIRLLHLPSGIAQDAVATGETPLSLEVVTEDTEILGDADEVEDVAPEATEPIAGPDDADAEEVAEATVDEVEALKLANCSVKEARGVLAGHISRTVVERAIEIEVANRARSSMLGALRAHLEATA